MKESRALRRSPVSRLGDSRGCDSSALATSDSSVANACHLSTCESQNLQFRRIRFKLSSARFELRSGSRGRQLKWTRNDHKPRGFFCLQVDRRGPVIVDVITLRKSFGKPKHNTFRDFESTLLGMINSVLTRNHWWFTAEQLRTARISRVIQFSA